MASSRGTASSCVRRLPLSAQLPDCLRLETNVALSVMLMQLVVIVFMMKAIRMSRITPAAERADREADEFIAIIKGEPAPEPRVFRLVGSLSY